jgi:hypothetical protein
MFLTDQFSFTFLEVREIPQWGWLPLNTSLSAGKVYTRLYPKVSGLSHDEINNNNKHSLRSNTKGYGVKTH